MVDWVPLGEVLQLDQDAVDVQADQQYRSAGLLNRGRGLFEKGLLNGADTSYTRLFRLSKGQVVYSKLFGWEGSIALVPLAFEGSFVSSEFPTFAVDSVRVAPEYLEQFLKSEQFTAEMAVSTNGLGQRRQRVNIDAFLSLKVPLPSRPDQDRIAAYLSFPALRVPSAPVGVDELVDPTLSSWLDSLPTKPLSHLAEIGPSPRRVGEDATIDFVPMGAVDAASGEITAPVLRLRGDLKSGYRQFEGGDILFARITPCMQNGKSAIYRASADSVGYGSTEFHVLRPSDVRLTEWLWRILRTDWFISRAAASFTGTAGQQRVPASFLACVEVPMPAFHELGPSIERLRSVRALTNQIKAAQRRRDQLAAAILPAARNEIFSAMR